MKPYKYCNNCGKQGHTFYSCKKPIISLGVIPFTITRSGDIKFLMICRKDSLGYVEFVRGKYPLYDKEYLSNIINEMSINEKNKLLEKSFDDLWTDLWGEFPSSQYKNEEEISRSKFEQLQRGILDSNNSNYNLETLVKKSDTKWLNPEWGFPKGRRDHQENDIPAALREFQEETGINKLRLELIQNILPYEEIFIGSNFRSYKHKYYLAYIDCGIIEEKLNYQKSEVSKVMWRTAEQCMHITRIYNTESIDIIKKANKTLLECYKIII